jgi:hypothetical protein
MEWGTDRREAIAQLHAKVRATGSFVDRALVREIKIASELFAERHAAWIEVVELVQHWENGVSDVSILEAVRQINRSASCWKTRASSNAPTGGWDCVSSPGTT